MYELKHLEYFAKTGDLLEITLAKLNDDWILMFSTSSIEGFSLHTARGQQRKFKSLDAVGAVAKELRDLAYYEGHDLAVTVDWI